MRQFLRKGFQVKLREGRQSLNSCTTARGDKSQWVTGLMGFYITKSHARFGFGLGNPLFYLNLVKVRRQLKVALSVLGKDVTYVRVFFLTLILFLA